MGTHGKQMITLVTMVTMLSSTGKEAQPGHSPQPDLMPEQAMEELQVQLEDSWAQGMEVSAMLAHAREQVWSITADEQARRYLQRWYGMLTVVVPPTDIPETTPPGASLSPWQQRWANEVRDLARCYLDGRWDGDHSSVFQTSSSPKSTTTRRRGKAGGTTPQRKASSTREEPRGVPRSREETQHQVPLPDRRRLRADPQRHRDTTSGQGARAQSHAEMEGQDQRPQARRRDHAREVQQDVNQVQNKDPNDDLSSFVVASKWLKKPPPARKDPAREAWRNARHRTQEVRVLHPSRPRPSARDTESRETTSGPPATTRPSRDRTCRPSARPGSGSGSAASGRAAPPETHEIDDDEEEELEEGEEMDTGLDFGPTEATELWRTLLEFEAAGGTASSSSTSQAFLPHYIVDNIQQATESMTDEEINIFLNEWVRIQARMGEQVHLGSSYGVA